MWASCCGLLNEVMGTGTVRAQQPGFGAGAGPFRFAPSAGYSTYPPPSSGSAGQLCKACGLAFSVFRRKVSRGEVESPLDFVQLWETVEQLRLVCYARPTRMYKCSTFLNVLSVDSFYTVPPSVQTETPKRLLLQVTCE